MMRQQVPSGKRVMAFARRAWIQQRNTALWLAALVGGACGVVLFLGIGNIAEIGDLPELMAAGSSDLVTVLDASGEEQIMTSYMLLMAPPILGALVAIVATLTLPGVVADDIEGGGIEVLLAGPIPRRALFTAYLGASLVLTAASWIVATAAFLITGGIMVLIQDLSVSFQLPYFAALIVLPLAMTIWSATSTLFGALLYPGSLESKAGMNGGPIRLLAMAPALVAVPSVMLLSDWVLLVLIVIAAAVVAATIVIIRLTARGFRSTKVLS
ncbi:ABC-2 transporter permease [Nesterenkonia ebinurensis]|uniref:hypothetical protein n=1 Tax=Nesterenkonia ebinurensis TaxID=2608252 RepID=UPI00123CE55F|nr:hypothetical protein [Nesterenkonia ebinurensis]